MADEYAKQSEVDSLKKRVDQLITGVPGTTLLRTNRKAFSKSEINKMISDLAASPLTTKGDLFTFDTDDARLPVGTDGQFLEADSAQALGMKWNSLTPGYAYFVLWAEESAGTATNNYEWSWGNGDEAASGGGSIIPCDCELYAIGSATSAADTSFRVSVMKNTVLAESSDTQTGQTEFTELITPVSFSKGDILDFKTHTGGSSTAGTRVFAYFRIEIIGAKGDPGAAGAPGDINWQGTWSAGTYNENDTVERLGSSYVCTALSTIEVPSLSAVDWDLVAKKGDTGPAGSALPYAHFIPTTPQNVGGANGTITYINWDGAPIATDANFTHSTTVNPSRIQVNANGRYEIKANVQANQTGSARTTLMSGLRVNGITANFRGRQRNYSRGSNYGDLGTPLCTEIDLTNGDYIEMSVTVDDTDSAYTINSIVAECEFIIRKLV